MPFSSHSISRQVLNIFPVPQFLRMHSAGLHITSDALRVIDFKTDKDENYIVSSYGEHKLPRGVIEKGAVKNAEEFTKALSEIKKKYGLKHVRASLPEERAYIFKTEVAHAAPNEVPEALEFKIEGNVPLDPSNVIFDYEVIETGHDRSDHIDSAVYVMPADIVRQYTEAIEKAGLSPLGYRVEAQAVTEAVVTRGDRRSLIVANIGDAQTGLYLVDNGVVHFSSTVDVGIKHLAETAEKEKDDADDEEGKVAAFPKPSSGANLADEIHKLESYWASHGKEKGGNQENIEEVIVCGRYVPKEKLGTTLFAGVKMPVRLANVWKNAFNFDSHIPEIPYEDSFRYAAAVGLALEEA